MLRWEDVPLPEPGPTEVLLRQEAIGLNYIDVYHRSGAYPLALPTTPGLEAAGVVEAVGPGVDHLKVGDRVAYAGGPLGAYSEARVIPADRLDLIDRQLGGLWSSNSRQQTADEFLEGTYFRLSGSTDLPKTIEEYWRVTLS